MNPHSVPSSSPATWSRDTAGLPCVDLDLETHFFPSAPFKHLMSTGKISVFADQWGNANPLTCEGGFVQFAPNEYSARSSMAAVFFPSQGDPVSLVYSELSGEKKIRYGTGYAVYSGLTAGGLRVTQEFLTPPGGGRYFVGRLRVENTQSRTVHGRMKIQSDVLPFKGGAKVPAPYPDEREFRDGDGWVRWETRDELKGVFLCGPEGWTGWGDGMTLNLRRDISLAPGGIFEEAFAFGYGEGFDPATIRSGCAQAHVTGVAGQWAALLGGVTLQAPEPWMVDEARWCMGQLYSFMSYDSSSAEYFASLGGYGWPSFSIREVAETAMALAYWDRDKTRSNLRWYARLQQQDGRFRQHHNFRSDCQSQPHAYDIDLWFVLGVTECVLSAGGDPGFLDERCASWDGPEETIWEHLCRAFRAILRCRGDRGLVLFPDWDDYLSGVGRGGKGQSVMNSGMAVRGFDNLETLARQRGQTEFAAEVARARDDMRRAVAEAFDGDWFLRGYKDDGSAFCSREEDRISLVSQAFAVLGRCGTPEQRRRALRCAIEKCQTPIGLMLMNRPVSCPPPPEISLCPIPSGEGENAGIWPQTNHWFIWALAEEGMIEEAWDCWKKASLHRHAAEHPEIPYGIFNGPDCYSSKWAGPREGWTQILLIDRAAFVPMNPAIAWQAFSMIKINEAIRRGGGSGH
ncbi:MAG: hypothetical protein SFY92_07620 [Verrucomicrobiae bacterium]|nr:hypothetical protein [Verrucomicrobiae bacterium]